MLRYLANIKQKTTWPAWITSFWAVALLLGVITLGVLSAVLVFQTTTFFTNLDNVDQFYTWYQKLATSLHHGYLPVWNANVFAGQSFAGELQPGVFYPLNIVWVMLFGSGAGISEMALNYLVAVHFWLAAFGAYLLLRQMKLSEWAALLAGVTFAFSGVVAFRSISQTAIFFGLTFIPYVLHFWLKFRDELRPRWALASGAFLGLILLVGHIQPFFHALLAIALYEVVLLVRGYRGLAGLWRSVLGAARGLALLGGAAVVIALPQLWVSASYLPHAYRIQAAGYAGPGEKIEYGAFAKAFNLDMHEFVNLIDPVSYPIRDGNNIFIGLAPLGVIVLVLWLARGQLRRGEQWQRYGVYCNTLLAASAVAMLGYVTWIAVVLYELPFVYQVRQLGRYSILFDLALAMLLALCLDIYAKITLSKKQARALWLIGGFLLLNAVYLFCLRHHVFGLHFALQMGLVGATVVLLPAVASGRIRKLALAGLLVLTAGVNTLWYLPHVQPNTKVVADYNLPASLVTQLEQTNGRYRVEDANGALPPNIGNVYAVQTTGGYAATVYETLYNFEHKSGLDPEFVRDILGVSLLASTSPIANTPPVYSDAAAKIYLTPRPTALPKAFTSSKPGSINRTDYHGLRVQTQHYRDQDQQFVVEVPSAQRVILSEINYPGWQATVDGKPVPLQAYAIGTVPLLQSLDLSAGRHTVRLVYKPFGLF